MWNTFVSAGIDAKTIAINIFAPDNLIACLTPFYHTAGNSLWVNHGFVVGNLTTAGLVGNNSNYLDSGVTGSAFPSDNSIGATMVTDGDASSGNFQNGSSNGALTTGIWLGRNTVTSKDTFATGGTSFATDASFKGAGFYSGSRIASNDIKLYYGTSAIAMSQIGSNTGAGASRDGNTMNVFSINLTGVSSNFSPCSDRISLMFWHWGLSSAETQIVFDAVKQMRGTLGGGFP